MERHDHAIRLKAEIMVDHFHEQVLARNRIGGQARAMVVTSGIAVAIQYFHALTDYLRERKSPYGAIVAFSGEHEFGDGKVTEATLNGFPSRDIADRIQEDPYRFLVCADKFQTGYDEPLLHTMYVDKPLSGIKAVQTLSRLNRAHPKKHDAFVLDFQNDSETIRDAFADHFRSTVLADKTDPDKLHDLQAELDGARAYTEEQVKDVARRFVDGEERDRLDPVLDACVAVYKEELDEDGQVAFKGNAKAFVRTYGFLSCVLPYTRVAWEERSIFLDLLVPKLPSPREDDLSRGILEAIDMESYRVEKQAAQRILLPDEDAEIDPIPTAGGGGRPGAGNRPAVEHPCGSSTSTSGTFLGRIPTESGNRVGLPRRRPRRTPLVLRRSFVRGRNHGGRARAMGAAYRPRACRDTARYRRCVVVDSLAHGQRKGRAPRGAGRHRQVASDRRRREPPSPAEWARRAASR